MFLRKLSTNKVKKNTFKNYNILLLAKLYNKKALNIVKVYLKG